MSRTTPARVYTRPSQAKWWKVCWMYGDRQLYGRTNAISQIGLDTGRNQNKQNFKCSKLGKYPLLWWGGIGVMELSLRKMGFGGSSPKNV
ncbi:hypothetical protein J6590_008914 [Homalodisca vitripennis]|nr:hypothetical protein J6590_008914 [Homalodisca vitripennis]